MVKDTIFISLLMATALGLRPPERQKFLENLLSICNIRVLLYKHTLTVCQTALRLDSSNQRIKQLVGILTLIRYISIGILTDLARSF